MNRKSKFLVIVLAIIVGILIYFCFEETIKFEKETENFETVAATYQYSSLGKCEHNFCTKRLYYKFAVDDGIYDISTDIIGKTTPPAGSKKLVKYAPWNPNIAYFSKISVVYLYYLISFFFGFTVLWVLFSQPQRKSDDNNKDKSFEVEELLKENVIVIPDPNAETKEKKKQEIKYKNERTLYVGQFVVGLLYFSICMYYYVELGKMLNTYNPFSIITLTFPVGIVLIVLALLSVFVTIRSLKIYAKKTKN